MSAIGHALHDRFAAGLRQAPSAVALVASGHELTYDALALATDRLAVALQERGVGPDTPVGVLADSALDGVIATLAILKAGGAFVPLDPQLPKARIQQLDRELELAHVVCSEALVDSVSDDRTRAIVVSATDPANPADRFPAETISGASLAYVLATSGSTGAPRFVGVSHHAADTAIEAALAHYRGLGPDAVVLGMSPPWFDPSVRELFATWSVGGCLVLLEAHQRREPEAVLRTIRARRVTHLLSVVPSLLSSLVTHPSWPQTRAGLDVVAASGERLEPAIVARGFDTGSPLLLNQYGTTEAVLVTTVQPASTGDDGAVGRPLAHAQVRILDDQLEPVAAGGVGEVCVAADLARGYVRAPALTAGRFVPDPWGKRGGRLYRTGDLGRVRADGRLELLGRNDDLVKVRGQRVALGHVASALKRLAVIDDAAVLDEPDEVGGTRLRAYVRLLQNTAPTLDEIMSAAGAVLPSHMVPARWTVVDRVPVNANGKLDRERLRACSASAPEITRVSAQTPASDGERALAAIWREVLGLDVVSRDDDFFELGGHSIVAARVVARVQEQLGQQLTVEDVFRARTLRELATALGERSRDQIAADVIARPRSEQALASLGQERLYFLEQLEPGTAKWIVPVAFRITGALDTGALTNALQGVTCQHPIFRTTVKSAAGTVVLSVEDGSAPDIAVEDLSIASTAATAETVRRRVDALAFAPFDLARGPLARVRLLRVAEDEHVLVIALHHLITDGRSVELLLREVADRYGALARGRAPQPQRPRLEYADFAAWQRRRLDDEGVQRQLEYWDGRLRGVQPVTLPADRPRDVTELDASGAAHAFKLGTPLVRRLSEFAAEHGCSLFMVVAAAFQALLSRYSRQDDVAVGMLVDGRVRSEFEDVFGYFANTVVLRTKIDADASFATVLDRVRAGTLEAITHQEAPFEQVVRRVAGGAPAVDTPLFNVALAAQNAGLERFSLHGVAVESLPLETQAAKFDLTLFFADDTADGRCMAEYRSSRFDRSTIERFARHLTALLAAAADDPRRSIDALDLTDHAGRAALVRRGRPEDRPRARTTLVEQFERQAAHAPDAAAVRFDGDTLTYGELDGRANALAQRLSDAGIGQESVVGVCTDRSLTLPVSLLGVLKAGAAYLPLDPAHPPARNASLLADCGASACIADAPIEADCPVWRSAEVLGTRASTPPPRALDARQLAYVIYTSGSTGRPKGVGVHHDAICNRLEWMQQAYELRAGERVLQKTPVTFDVSVWEIFWPLLCGGTLVIAQPGRHGDADYIAEAITDEGIDVVHFVPSMLRALVSRGHTRALRRCRVVCLSGEALAPDLARVLLDELAETTAVENLYGPTEAAVDVTRWPVQRRQDGRIPIGTPITNAAVHVLDGEGAPSDTGLPGELVIGGTAPARGYVGQPDLTAARFVPDPIGGVGARIYRTGDRARWLPDGEIEFLGRDDDQVKIRGYRIELGEIEAALRALPGVTDAAAVVQHDAAGQHLAAAIVGTAEAVPDPAGARALLRDTLPDYMVPTTWWRLDHLPTTSAGKLDRRALAETAPGPAPTRSTPATPADTPVAAIARAFADALGVEHVADDDDFFELGGHSLLALAVVDALQPRFGRIRVRQLLDARTPEALAASLAKGAAAHNDHRMETAA